MAQEDFPIAEDLPAAETEPAALSSGELAAQPARTGALAMGAAGLLAGIAGWLILEISFPFFAVSEELQRRIPLSFPPPELLAEFAAAKRTVNLHNAWATGLLLGALVAVLFALVQGASRGFWRSRVPMALCVICGSAAGAAAGLAGQIALNRLLATAEPLTAAVAFQAVFWTVLGAGAGAGVGAFAGSGSRLFGLLLQGMLVGAVFGLVYASAAAFVFPVDNAERLVPASLANRAVWAVVGMGSLGLLLGSALQGRRRRRG